MNNPAVTGVTLSDLDDGNHTGENGGGRHRNGQGARPHLNSGRSSRHSVTRSGWQPCEDQTLKEDHEAAPCKAFSEVATAVVVVVVVVGRDGAVRCGGNQVSCSLPPPPQQKKNRPSHHQQQKKKQWVRGTRLYRPGGARIPLVPCRMVNYSKSLIIVGRADLGEFFRFIFVGKMCVFVSRPNFLWERDTLRNKIMKIVEDFDEKSHNNNGKSWKYSKILRVKPHFFIFYFSSFFIHFFLHFSSFFSCFHFIFFSFFCHFFFIFLFSPFFFISDHVFNFYLFLWFFHHFLQFSSCFNIFFDFFF